MTPSMETISSVKNAPRRIPHRTLQGMVSVLLLTGCTALSTPEVVSRSPTCTSALPDMKRSSTPPLPPKAALRCCVRVLSTGIAASLSVSSVTSEPRA